MNAAENHRKIKVVITIVMSLPELLKGTSFFNSIDETFSESFLSSVCNHFLCVIVLDRCAPKEMV
jgi:hypothetical protein